MNKILLIEDNFHLREIIKIKLHYDCNVEVETASSAIEAIEMLKRNPIYTFIICDYIMSEKNGIHVLRYLEGTDLNIPFVFFTSTINLEIETIYPMYLGIIYKLEYERLVKSIITIL